MNVYWRALMLLNLAAFSLMLSALTSLTSYDPDDTNATMS
jgi:hypothetical protein